MQPLYIAEPTKAYRLGETRPLGTVGCVGTATLTVQVKLKRTNKGMS